MRLNVIGGIIATLVIVALIVAYTTLFTVYQTRQALVVRLGNPVRIITDFSSWASTKISWWPSREVKSRLLTSLLDASTIDPGPSSGWSSSL